MLLLIVEKEDGFECNEVSGSAQGQVRWCFGQPDLGGDVPASGRGLELNGL